VRDFTKYAAKSHVTLMAPEPTGGIYRDEGVEVFLRRFGYPDKAGKTGRVNFGGIYTSDRDFHADTGLALRLTGFDAATGKITDVDGAIMLVDRAETVAASWSFKGIMAHWNRKHAKAAYVKSLMRDPPPNYSYGPIAQMNEGTDVLLLLGAFACGAVYYDPGIKLERSDTDKLVTKQRSQFQVKHGWLKVLYRNSEVVDLLV